MASGCLSSVSGSFIFYLFKSVLIRERNISEELESQSVSMDVTRRRRRRRHGKQWPLFSE